MHGSLHRLGSLLLIPLCACPVTVAPPERLIFSCAEGDECLSGYICVAGRCVTADQDAGVVAEDGGADDGAAADVLPADRPQVDALAADAPLRDIPPADTAAVDTVLADSAAADALLQDGMASDVASVDVSVPDAPLSDSTPPDGTQPDTASGDGGQPDTLQPDTSQPDSTQPDSYQPDTYQPDTSIPDTILEDSCVPPAGPPWWDHGYAFRYPLSVEAAPEDYTVELRLTGAAAAALFARSAAGGDDLRVVHHDSTAVEIDRELRKFADSSVVVRFNIGIVGGFGGGSQTYYIYIGNSSPSPPLQDLHNVYLFFDDFEGFSAGEDGAPVYDQQPSGAWRMYRDNGNMVLRAQDGWRMMLNIVGQDRRNGAMEARMMFPSLVGSDFGGFMFWGETINLDSLTVTTGAIHEQQGEAGISSWVSGTYNSMLDSTPFTPSAGVWYDISTRFLGNSCSFALDGAEQGALDYRPTTGQLIGLAGYDTDVYYDDLKVRLLQDPEPAVGLGAEEQPCQ